jgi:hypothetical protein
VIKEFIQIINMKILMIKEERKIARVKRIQLKLIEEKSLNKITFSSNLNSYLGINSLPNQLIIFHCFLTFY